AAELRGAAPARPDATASGVAGAWEQALSRQESSSHAIASRNSDALAAAAGTFEQHAASLLAAVDRSHTALQASLAAQDEQRLAAWTTSLTAMGDELRAHWTQAGGHVAERQQQICDTLARTAEDITTQAQAHAGATIEEIARLVQAASEAPRAAAEVVAELR